MQEISRAILLPPPTPPSSRSAARGAAALDQDLPNEIEGGTRRTTTSIATSFLTLVETRREDTVEVRGKQFRFRPYTSRGAAHEQAVEDTKSEQSSELAEADGAGGDHAAVIEVLDGFGSGDGSRNSSAFLASFIAQERLSEGLYNPAFGAASDAYRQAGGSPPAGGERPRIVRLAA